MVNFAIQRTPTKVCSTLSILDFIGSFRLWSFSLWYFKTVQLGELSDLYNYPTGTPFQMCSWQIVQKIGIFFGKYTRSSIWSGCHFNNNNLWCSDSSSKTHKRLILRWASNKEECLWHFRKINIPHRCSWFIWNIFRSCFFLL